MTDSHSEQTTTATFNIALSVEVVSKAIYGNFIKLVSISGKELNMTEDHTTAIHQAAIWLTQGTTYGLKILGKPGTGKSTLLRSICMLINDYSNGLPISRRCGLVEKNASEITEESIADAERYKHYYNYRFLAIDDLGTEPLTVKHYGNDIMPIVDIIRRRCDNWKTTIIVSNLDGESIKNRYEGRIYDRLRDMTTILLDGQSNRGTNR